VLCRHKSIAEASVEVLRETTLLRRDRLRQFSELRSGRINAGKGNLCPDLNKWDYDLPTTFYARREDINSVAASEHEELIPTIFI